MGIFSHEERASHPLVVPILANGLRNGQNVGFGEGRIRARAPMAACAEAHKLVGVGNIGFCSVERLFEFVDVNQEFFGGRLAG